MQREDDREKPLQEKWTIQGIPREAYEPSSVNIGETIPYQKSRMEKEKEQPQRTFQGQTIPLTAFSFRHICCFSSTTPGALVTRT